MTNQQLYLAVGLPILVNLLTTGLIMLYVAAKVDAVERRAGARCAIKAP